MDVNFQALAIISVLTALTTECIKTLCKKSMINYVSNIIAAIVSVILSSVMMIVKPVLVDGVPLSGQLIYNGVVMAFFGVLCATLSFDKVKQALDRLKG